MFTVKKSTINWLIDTTGTNVNQPVVYLTLKKILGKTDRSKQVKDAFQKINEYPAIKKILSKSALFWRPGEFLFDKYQGGFWQLSFLGDLNANPNHPEIKRGIEFILERPDVHGFYGVHCLTSNLYRAMMKFGYERDDRVMNGVEYQCNRIVDNKGADCYVMDYSLLTTCQMTLSKILFTLGNVPADLITAAMRRAKNIILKKLRQTKIFRYVPRNSEIFRKKVEEFTESAPLNRRRMLREDILAMKKDYLKSPGLGGRTEKPEWTQFGFPNSYNTDILEMMLALESIGAPKHREFIPALELIKDKVEIDSDGRQFWRMERTLNDQMLAPVEELNKPSKWLTLHALIVLKHFDGIRIKK